MIPVFRLGHVPSPDGLIEVLALHGWDSCSRFAPEIRQKGDSYHEGNMQFHKDGVSSGPYFAVWSNSGGTIVKIPSSTGYRILVAEPFELIVIDNNLCVHRSPYVIDDKRIWARISPVKRAEKEGTN